MTAETYYGNDQQSFNQSITHLSRL